MSTFCFANQAVTANRLAKEYNEGLDEAVRQAHEHNRKIVEDFKAVGVIRAKHFKHSLVPIPRKCPTNLDKRWVRKFLLTFGWTKASRNTAGQYLEAGIWFRNFVCFAFISKTNYNLSLHYIYIYNIV